MAKSTERTVLVWFTRDLRLHDQAALQAASGAGRVVAAYVHDRALGGAWAPGGAARWWLHHSLASLAADLAARGVTLVLRQGETVAEVARLAAEVGAEAVFAGQPVEPAGRAAVDRLRPVLAARGCRLELFWTTLLFDPGELQTKTGTPYFVFTPFARACAARGVRQEPLPAPARLSPAPAPATLRLDDLRLLPVAPDWAGGLRDTWKPGEAAARAALARFLQGPVAAYAETRNLPAVDGVSRLSAHLHWGEISANEVWWRAGARPGEGSSSFVNEIFWREFGAHLLWHHPEMPDRPLKASFEKMRWRNDGAGLRAWQRGQTGIPIVDAGMRQLWRTGWQHNRVRMITASFLIKHLLIDWREGEAWFWDTLVDADLGSNAGNWQWVAGCGADAAPFFRIFNPELQGRKFDPDGRYVARYVPELAKLPAKYIHAPHEAPADVLRAAGVELGRSYPEPIVDLALGRERALAAFKHVSEKIRA